MSKMTLKDRLYLENLKDSLSQIHFDATAHLFLNKRVSKGKIRELVYVVDRQLQRAILGRRYNKKDSQERCRFWAFYEKSPSNDNSHIHLMIKFGHRDRLYRLPSVLKSIWTKLWVGGTVGLFQFNTSHIKDDNRRQRAHQRNNGFNYTSFTPADIAAQVDYYMKSLDSDSFIPSRGWDSLQ